ncbi:Pentatricopeptide repeat-containing protein [Platanthera zijinensis]|uniref:Pentatricopeptide repeat-containing protein n=1 Tax=Platanthera zijinensis TaxID=2320716 RepID=A0AAP0GG07_9ASPA
MPSPSRPASPAETQSSLIYSNPPHPRPLFFSSALFPPLLIPLFPSIISSPPYPASAPTFPPSKPTPSFRFLSVPIDRSILPPVLRSAAFLFSIAAGHDAHALAFKTGLADHLPVATALIRFYFSLELSDRARLIFDRCRTSDSILWNTSIAGLIRCHEFDSAHHLFGKMLPRDRNIASWNCMIDMCCNKTGDVGMGRKMFDEMPKKDIVSWNVMISGYARIMDCISARKLFDQMLQRDVVSWNVLISCYVKQGFFSEAVDLFRKMQGLVAVRPNQVTVTEVLPACSYMGALDLATWIHAYIERQRMPIDLQLTTALVNVYGRCGCIENAQKVFSQARKRDAFLCSTMMEVLAMHGMANEVFGVFDNMRSEGIKPNDVTMIGLLKACAYEGLLEIGLGWFNKMEDELGLSPKMEHYGCIVELLGRAGKLDDAHQLILNMPMEPSAVVWSSLLNACGIHGDMALAEKAGSRLIELEPGGCGNYIRLSNLYSAGRRWKDAEKTRKLMKESSIIKKPGCSSIEVGNRVYEFYAGDRSHPECREIYEMLHRVAVRLEQAGCRSRKVAQNCLRKEACRMGRFLGPELSHKVCSGVYEISKMTMLRCSYG